MIKIGKTFMISKNCITKNYNQLKNDILAQIDKVDIIGKNYKGFTEAEELIKLGGVYSVKDPDEFCKVFSKLNDTELRIRSGKISFDYILKSVEKNSIILNSLSKNL